jgi:hypothetical protein
MGISVSPVPSPFGKLRIAFVGEPTASNRRDGVGGLACRGLHSRCVELSALSRLNLRGMKRAKHQCQYRYRHTNQCIHRS